MIKKRFKEYFNFTKKERNGIIVLLSILIILIGVNQYLKNQTYGNIVLMSEEFQKDIDQFEKSLVSKENYKEINEKDEKIKNESLKLFDFDPNTIDKKDLSKLGLNKKQVSTLVNYREKGGVFYKKEDLLKIYGLNDDLYKILEPYIKIETEEKESVTVNDEEKITELLELNSATQEDLINLPGIGESYANRIISYRKLLRGYYDKSQLLEVYGFDSTRYVNIKDLVIIDTNLIESININTSKYKTILRHPYLSKYQTEGIMKYRELSGKFNSLEQLVEINVLNKKELEKVKPYITLDTLYNKFDK